MRKKISRITPNLWFNDKAEQAVKFYLSIFKNSRIKNVTRYGEEGAKISGRVKGTVMTISFELDGQEFIALNGGPIFTFSPSISFIVNCKSQDEVDDYWMRLSEGGEPGQCGWLKDRYGVSWQIVPIALGKMLQIKDHARYEKVMNALLQMTKIDLNLLERAYGGRMQKGTGRVKSSKTGPGAKH